jgi:flagellar basal-body rod protein FlgC
MTIFPAFDIAGSALTTDQTWMDAISDNLANVNTVKPFDQPAFQARFIEAQALPSNPGDPVGVGGGVEVASVQYGDSTGVVHSDPGNPLSNSQGLIRSPDIDMAQNMTDLIIAQRAYELNLSVVQSASQSYQQAIQINGKS